MVALRDESNVHRFRRRRHHLRFVDAEPEPVMAPLSLVRRDTLPEHADYRDTGCDLYVSCLRCPLARCKYDEPMTARQATTAARDREIALLRRKHRAPIEMLSGTYGLTPRTIFRILSEQPLRENKEQ